jgi:hypothetical protein
LGSGLRLAFWRDQPLDGGEPLRDHRSFTALQWIAVILLATALDLGVRFGLQPDFRVSLWIEGGTFLLTAAVLLWLYRIHPARPGWRRGLQVLLVAAFALGGLRSLLWAAGNPVTRANLKVLVLGVIAWAYVKRRKRNAARDGAETELA